MYSYSILDTGCWNMKANKDILLKSICNSYLWSLFDKIDDWPMNVLPVLWLTQELTEHSENIHITNLTIAKLMKHELSWLLKIQIFFVEPLIAQIFFRFYQWQVALMQHNSCNFVATTMDNQSWRWQCSQNYSYFKNKLKRYLYFFMWWSKLIS